MKFNNKTVHECRAHEFRCVSDGLCLDKLRLCDGINHCADGSDESEVSCDPQNSGNIKMQTYLKLTSRLQY